MNVQDQSWCQSKAHCLACRTDAEFRASLFAAKKAPGADFDCPKGFTAETAPQPQVAPPGAGTQLKALLQSFGIGAEAGCGCWAMATRMDREGLDWCQENIPLIVIAMIGEAEKRQWVKYLPWKERGARWFVERAIASAQNNLAKGETVTKCFNA